MNNQIDALKKELYRSKEQKRELAHQLAIASLKLDFPLPNSFVQDWHERKYGIENWLTTMAWDLFDFDFKPFKFLLSEIKDISEELAESLIKNGFDYEIRLPHEPFKASGYISGNLGFDISEWERNHYEIWSSLDDNLRDDIIDIISQTGEMILDKILSILKQNNVEKEEYCKFISPNDLVSGLVKIKQVDDYGIQTNVGYLCGRGNNFDEWDFINKYRGCLVGYHQIYNPIMLTNDLKNQTIFVVE